VLEPAWIKNEPLSNYCAANLADLTDGPTALDGLRKQSEIPAPVLRHNGLS
jgi:hypothetical protein